MKKNKLKKSVRSIMNNEMKMNKYEYLINMIIRKDPSKSNERFDRQMIRIILEIAEGAL